MTYSSKELAYVPEPMRTARALRRLMKITQDEAAAMLGLDIRTLKRLELGGRPSNETRRKVELWIDRWRAIYLRNERREP